MKFLFVTGMGRSGTKFLSQLLGLAPNAEVLHEFIGNREFALLSWYLQGKDYAIPYLVRSRETIENRFNGQTEYFIDVNSGLQNSALELKRVFDGAPVFHLVRNPQAVIRSIYNRRNDERVHLIPKQQKEIEQWLDADKFEQICWNWAETTRRLFEQQTILLQLEKVVSDFEYLRERLVEPYSLQLSRQRWNVLRSKKTNRTRSQFYRYFYAKVKAKKYNGDRLPSYDQWTEAQKGIYTKICGDLAKQLGYK